MTESAVEELVAGYGRQLVLYRRLLDLERRDAAEGDALTTQETIARLREKTRLLGEAGELEAALAPHKAAWRASSPHPGLSVGALRALVAQITDILEELLRLGDDERRRFADREMARRAPSANAPRPLCVATYASAVADRARLSVQG